MANIDLTKIKIKIVAALKRLGVIGGEGLLQDKELTKIIREASTGLGSQVVGGGVFGGLAGYGAGSAAGAVRGEGALTSGTEGAKSGALLGMLGALGLAGALKGISDPKLRKILAEKLSKNEQIAVGMGAVTTGLTSAQVISNIPASAAGIRKKSNWKNESIQDFAAGFYPKSLMKKADASKTAKKYSVKAKEILEEYSPKAKELIEKYGPETKNAAVVAGTLSAGMTGAKITYDRMMKNRMRKNRKKANKLEKKAVNYNPYLQAAQQFIVPTAVGAGIGGVGGGIMGGLRGTFNQQGFVPGFQEGAVEGAQVGAGVGAGAGGFRALPGVVRAAAPQYAEDIMLRDLARAGGYAQQNLLPPVAGVVGGIEGYRANAPGAVPPPEYYPMPKYAGLKSAIVQRI